MRFHPSQRLAPNPSRSQPHLHALVMPAVPIRTKAVPHICRRMECRCIRTPSRLRSAAACPAVATGTHARRLTKQPGRLAHTRLPAGRAGGTHSGATGRPAALPCKRSHSSRPLVLTVVLIAAVLTASSLHAAPAFTTYSSPRHGSRRRLPRYCTRRAASPITRGSGRVRTVCIAGPRWRRLPDVLPASDSVACPLTFAHGAIQGGGKSTKAAGPPSVASINLRDDRRIGKEGPWFRPTKVPDATVHRANDSYLLVLLLLLQASS